MRQALFPSSPSKPEGNSARLALLPGLCCLAMGGQRETADTVAAAWMLYYTAADLMDSVEDQDEPDPWWASLGPGIALNVSSGLFFSAAGVLLKLFHKTPYPVALEISEDFQRTFLKMCSGQHHDLRQKDPSLKAFWDTAAEKSGAFFALACRCGARLAIHDILLLEHFTAYGFHLGMLIQILDDLKEIQPPLPTSPNQWLKLKRALPVIYAMEVLPQEGKSRLTQLLETTPPTPNICQETLKIVEESGAALYLAAEIERRRTSARTALKLTNSVPTAENELLCILDSLGRR